MMRNEAALGARRKTLSHQGQRRPFISILQHCFCHSGFTLLELLLVLLLLAVTTSLALPNFRKTYQDLIWQRAVDDLIYQMRYAQSRAVTQGRCVRLTLAKDQQSYWLEDRVSENQTTNEATDSFVPISGSWGRHKRISEEFSISPLTGILFYPDGTIEKKSISLCRGQRCRTISTREQRGTILVYDGGPDGTP